MKDFNPDKSSIVLHHIRSILCLHYLLVIIKICYVIFATNS